MKTLPPETRSHIEAWIEKTYQSYNTDDSEPVQDLLEAYDEACRERAWIYNLTVSSNVSEDMKEMVDDILDAERERHYAREDRLEAAKKLLREAVAITDTLEMREDKLDAWIELVKSFLEDRSLTATKKIIGGG